MKRIDAGALSIAYLESGPPDGTPVILSHGFPYDVRAYDEVAAQLAEAGLRVIVPWLRGYGPTRFRSAETPRSGAQAALGADLLALMDALGISKAILGGYDGGGRAACVVAALHPERCAGLVSCGDGYNIQNIPASGAPDDPATEQRFWYQYYLHGERGARALVERRDALLAHIWRIWSPSWAEGPAAYAASAPSFENPDFAAVALHSYRHRFALVPGDPAHEAWEAALAAQPDIAAPTVVLQGADDGVDPPTGKDASAPHFKGRYRREILQGVGHNLPQEAPEAFADAVLSLT